MFNPDEKQIHALAYVKDNVPGVTEWLELWAEVELDRLPNVPSASVAVAQGRCQVLKEVLKAFQDAPTMVANPHRGKLPSQPLRTPLGA